jgi:TPR repeat protein
MLVRQAHHRGFEKRLVDDAQACRVRAEQGDAFSQYTLALMYHHGKGLPQDYGEAFRWYRKAADQGNVKAQYALGYMNYIGEGVPQNFNEAFNWYHKAADQGYSKAQYALGLSFYNGRGGPQDFVESARWYRKAADQGIAQAQYCLGYMYLYGQGVPQDREEADRWFHKAADQGDENAQRILGIKQAKWTKALIFILLFKLIVGIPLSIGFMLPGMSLGNVRQRIITGMGVLSLLSAGLSWLSSTHFEMQQTKSVHIALALITWLLDGTLLVLLFYIFGSGKKASVDVAHP